MSWPCFSSFSSRLTWSPLPVQVNSILLFTRPLLLLSTSKPWKLHPSGCCSVLKALPAQSKPPSTILLETTGNATWHLPSSVQFSHSVQLSPPYMITGKIRGLTRWTFVSKVTSLLFNMLSTLVIAFLPRNKHLNFMAPVTICSDFGAQENSLSLFPLFPRLFARSDGTRCHDLSFLNVEF